MNWVRVDSTMITHVAHENETIFVRFRDGAEYRYNGVPDKVIEEFLRAPSKGSFVNKVLKGHYTSERI